MNKKINNDVAADITNLREVGKRLRRANRSLRMLTAAGHAMGHAEDETMLFNEICNIIVEVGGYRMSWIGLAEENGTIVRPKAHCGYEDGYLEKVDGWYETIAEPGPLAELANDLSYGFKTLRMCAERRQAEKRIYGQLKQLSALRTIDLAISSSLDIRVTLKIFLEEVLTQLRVDAANVLLLNPQSKLLEYAAGQGFRTVALRHSHLRVGEGHAGVAALENRIVSIPNLKVEGAGFKRSRLLEGEDFITYYGIPLVAKGHVKGVLEIFNRTPLDPGEEWLDFAEALALQAAIAIDNNSLFHDLERSNMELMLAYESTIEGWSRALDYRDKETEGHSRRVTELTVRIAFEMRMSNAEIVHVRRGALLHDIGKLGIPDSILLKPGRLTEDEWKIMRLHPVYSYELLNPIAYLRPAIDIPYCHHEFWDGNGYPRGLKEKQIPLQARIFSVVDVWDALCSDRPYRPAWSEEKAKEYIGSLSGIQFDPMVVEAFLRVPEKDGLRVIK